MLVMPTVLIIAINICLYLQDFRDSKETSKQLAHDSSRLDILRKRLQEQIKSTVSILLLGGIDGLLNAVTVSMYPPILHNSGKQFNSQTVSYCICYSF